jgi:hypothetical protein
MSVEKQIAIDYTASHYSDMYWGNTKANAINGVSG